MTHPQDSTPTPRLGDYAWTEAVVTPTTIEVQARLRRVQLLRRLSGEMSR